MRIVIVYESMFGNTRLVAEAVAKGFAGHDVRLAPVAEAEQQLLDWADLVVIGAPTHVHGMSRPTTRKSAAEMAAKPGSGLAFEPCAEGRGVREWLEDVRVTGRAAVFDTRMRMPRFVTGSAAKGVARRLRRHGARIVAKPVSFFVTKANTPYDGEVERARAWGQSLATGLGQHRERRAASDRLAS